MATIDDSRSDLPMGPTVGRKLAVYAMAIIAALSVFVSAVSADDAPSCVFEGTVVDEAKQPVAGANIALSLFRADFDIDPRVSDP